MPRTVIFCVLIAVSLFISCSNRQQSVAIANSNENISDGLRNGGSAPKAGCHAPGSNYGHNHEPPIGTGRGSAFFDIPKTVFPTRMADTNDQSRFKLSKSSGDLTAIDCVSVLSETDYPFFEVFELGKDAKETKLVLTLGNAPGSLSTEKVIFDCVSSPCKLIFDDKGYKLKLKPNPHKKDKRPNRIVYANKKLFVVKWELSAKNMVTKSGSGADFYYIHIGLR